MINKESSDDRDRKLPCKRKIMLVERLTKGQYERETT